MLESKREDSIVHWNKVKPVPNVQNMHYSFLVKVGVADIALTYLTEKSRINLVKLKEEI